MHAKPAPQLKALANPKNQLKLMDKDSQQYTYKNRRKSLEHKNSGLLTLYVWTCCRCQQASMTVFIPVCPEYNCCHIKCDNCPVEYIKVRNDICWKPSNGTRSTVLRSNVSIPVQSSRQLSESRFDVPGLKCGLDIKSAAVDTGICIESSPGLEQ